MNRINNRQTVVSPQDVIDEFNKRQTFDSQVRSDGWTLTSKSNLYVAFNKYAHRRNAKVTYVISVRKRLRCLCLRLYVSSNNPVVDDFRTVVESNNEEFKNFNGNRDCGVERNINLELGCDRDAAITQVLGELDKLYKVYNAVVDVGCTSKTKGTCKDTVCVEALTVPEPNPTYNLSWKGWKKFYDEWDEFVKTWFESGANPQEKLTQELEESGAFQRMDANTRLDRTELPEPYYGIGENAKCVVVHLNPGASCNGEVQKIWGKGGFLIKSFESNCDKSYSRFVQTWSPLKDSYVGKRTDEVPGHDWWHEENRQNFIQRFFGVQSLSDVFALEACPYHSKRWSGGLDAIEKHVTDKVILPAAIVAERNNNCAVFVGGAFNAVIAKIKGVEVIGRWRGTRVYSLYKLTHPIEGLDSRKTIYLLVANGTQGMYLPQSNKFNDAIEKIIHGIVNGGSGKSETAKGE